MLISNLFRDAAVVIVVCADDRDVEALFGEPLYHAIKFFDERADQIIEQIDATRGKAFFRFLVQSMKPEHEAIARAERRHVAHHRKLAQAGILSQQRWFAALDAGERIVLAAGVLVGDGERRLGKRALVHLPVSAGDAEAEADARRENFHSLPRLGGVPRRRRREHLRLQRPHQPAREEAEQRAKHKAADDDSERP